MSTNFRATSDVSVPLCLFPARFLTHRDTEDTEVAQRKIFLTDVNCSPAEEQPANFICQIVIAHDVDLPLIERSNGVESAVDEIKQVGR